MVWSLTLICFSFVRLITLVIVLPIDCFWDVCGIVLNHSVLSFLPMSAVSLPAALSGPLCHYRYIYIYTYLRGRPPNWRRVPFAYDFEGVFFTFVRSAAPGHLRGM